MNRFRLVLGHLLVYRAFSRNAVCANRYCSSITRNVYTVITPKSRRFPCPNDVEKNCYQPETCQIHRNRRHMGCCPIIYLCLRSETKPLYFHCPSIKFKLCRFGLPFANDSLSALTGRLGHFIDKFYLIILAVS